ncbi:MAG: PH domain-containing protein [bacterium]|nr:PH domain-containing protein [bacterium]
MKISMSKTREQFPLSTKKVLKKTVAGTLIWSILLFIIWLFVTVAVVVNNKSSAGIAGIITLAIFGLMALIIFGTYFYQKWYYSVYFYDLTDDFIIIKKGPITPSEITIPYERVQDVYVDQDLLDRLFGIYDVHLSSATISSGMEAHIDGVEKVAADGLRGFLLQTVQQKIGRKNNQNLNNNQPNQ